MIDLIMAILKWGGLSLAAFAILVAWAVISLIVFDALRTIYRDFKDAAIPQDPEI